MRIKSAKTVLQRIFFLLLTVFLFSVGTVNAQTCDPNPACDPTSGTCCPNQCDPNPACVANDPNAMPCCNAGPEHGGPGPNNHGDSCMNMSPGPAQDACFKDKDDHHGGPNDHHNGPGDHGPCPPDCGPGPNHMSGGNTGMPGGPNHPPGPGGPNHPPGPGNNSAAGQFIDPDCPPGTPAGTTCLPGGIIKGANGNNAGNPDQFIDPDCPPGTPAGTTCLPQ